MLLLPSSTREDHCPSSGPILVLDYAIGRAYNYQRGGNFLVLCSADAVRGRDEPRVRYCEEDYYKGFAVLTFDSAPVVDRGFFIVDFERRTVTQRVLWGDAIKLRHKGGSKYILDLRVEIATLVHQEMARGGIGDFQLVIVGYSLKFHDRHH